MPQIQGNTATLTGATTANVLAGSAYEFAPYNCVAQLACTAEAAGESRVTVQAGSRVVMEESPVSRANRVPIVPDDVTIQGFGVRAGERIIVRHRNTGLGTNTLFWAVYVRRVGR